MRRLIKWVRGLIEARRRCALMEERLRVLLAVRDAKLTEYQVQAVFHDAEEQPWFLAVLQLAGMYHAAALQRAADPKAGEREAALALGEAEAFRGLRDELLLQVASAKRKAAESSREAA